VVFSKIEALESDLVAIACWLKEQGDERTAAVAEAMVPLSNKIQELTDKLKDKDKHLQVCCLSCIVHVAVIYVRSTIPGKAITSTDFTIN
jgi:hypothetical protein